MPEAPRSTLAAWASRQARAVTALSLPVEELRELAAAVVSLGGDPAGLPIACVADGNLDTASLRDWLQARTDVTMVSSNLIRAEDEEFPERWWWDPYSKRSFVPDANVLWTMWDPRFAIVYPEYVEPHSWFGDARRGFTHWMRLLEDSLAGYCVKLLTKCWSAGIEDLFQASSFTTNNGRSDVREVGNAVFEQDERIVGEVVSFQRP